MGSRPFSRISNGSAATEAIPSSQRPRGGCSALSRNTWSTTARVREMPAFLPEDLHIIAAGTHVERFVDGQSGAVQGQDHGQGGEYPAGRRRAIGHPASGSIRSSGEVPSCPDAGPNGAGSCGSRRDGVSGSSPKWNGSGSLARSAADGRRIHHSSPANPPEDAPRACRPRLVLAVKMTPRFSPTRDPPVQVPGPAVPGPRTDVADDERYAAMLPFSLSDIPLISRYIGVLVFLEGSSERRQCAGAGADGAAPTPGPSRSGCCGSGSGGPIGFRFIAVLLSAVLLKFWIFKVLGGGYLLYLAIKHFAGGESGRRRARGAGTEHLLGHGGGRDLRRHRVLDRFDPRRSGDGRGFPRPVRRRRQGVHRLRRRRARHHHDAVRRPLLHHPARKFPGPGPGRLRPRGLDRSEAVDQRALFRDADICPIPHPRGGSSGR